MPPHCHPAVLCPSAEVHQAPRAGFQLGQCAVENQASPLPPQWWTAVTAPSFGGRELHRERTPSPHICLSPIPSPSTPTLLQTRLPFSTAFAFVICTPVPPRTYSFPVLGTLRPPALCRRMPGRCHLHPFLTVMLKWLLSSQTCFKCI